MAGERHDITVTITTLDIDHWHPGWLAAAEASGSGYHEWVVDRLREHVQQAVDEFANTHPDLLATDPDVH